MSGQTIEVLNTDAEGRLVLADVLWYAQERFKPRFMVDLATLTGAIIVALGKEYAGLFANDDELARELAAAGEATGEKVWRMPLAKAYDKLIDSKNADMKNIGGRHGGAITARSSCSASSRTRPGRTSTSPAPPWTPARNEINQSWGSRLGRAPARPPGGRQLREGRDVRRVIPECLGYDPSGHKSLKLTPTLTHCLYAS